MTHSYNAFGIEPDDANKSFNAVSIEVLEKNVRFSLRYCDTKKYCISKLQDSKEAKRFIETLGKFEDMSWRQVRQIPHDKGMSQEKKDSDNYKMLKASYSNFSNFAHFRVNGTDHPFRIFGSMNGEMFYILLVDRKGSVNH